MVLSKTLTDLILWVIIRTMVSKTWILGPENTPHCIFSYSNFQPSNYFLISSFYFFDKMKTLTIV